MKVTNYAMGAWLEIEVGRNPDVECDVPSFINIRASNVVTYTSGQIILRTPTYTKVLMTPEGYEANITVTNGEKFTFHFDTRNELIAFCIALDEALQVGPNGKDMHYE